jgi:hypothetical protein
LAGALAAGAVGVGVTVGEGTKLLAVGAGRTAAPLGRAVAPDELVPPGEAEGVELGYVENLGLPELACPPLVGELREKRDASGMFAADRGEPRPMTVTEDCGVLEAVGGVLAGELAATLGVVVAGVDEGAPERWRGMITLLEPVPAGGVLWGAVLATLGLAEKVEGVVLFRPAVAEGLRENRVRSIGVAGASRLTTFSGTCAVAPAGGLPAMPEVGEGVRVAPSIVGRYAMNFPPSRSTRVERVAVGECGASRTVPWGTGEPASWLTLLTSMPLFTMTLLLP